MCGNVNACDDTRGWTSREVKRLVGIGGRPIRAFDKTRETRR